MFASSAWLASFCSLILLPFVTCDSDDNTAAAVFVYPTDAGPDFAFALNAVQNGDLYFHMSGPTQYSWMAIGIGQDMDDNLMFIVHEGASKGSLTLSPRVAMNGESEPTYYPAIHCDQLPSDTSGSTSSESMSLSAVCHNATSWDKGSLDLSSSSQDFMFAFGPPHKLQSDSFSAPLLRHELYGNFVMDMTKATSNSKGSVPQPNGSNDAYVSLNSSDAQEVTSDSDKSVIVHGVVACIAYILLYPLGALILRLAGRLAVRMHWIWQTIASILVVVGFGLGAYASTQYNRSRDFSDPHQIIGIVLLLAVATQITLGAVHHMIFKKKGKSTILGKVHRIVGPLIIFVAIVNGGLGLDLACKSGRCHIFLHAEADLFAVASTGSKIAYAVVVAVFAVALIGVWVWAMKRSKRNGAMDKIGDKPGHHDSVPLHERA